MYVTLDSALLGLPSLKFHRQFSQKDVHLEGKSWRNVTLLALGSWVCLCLNVSSMGWAWLLRKILTALEKGKETGWSSHHNYRLPHDWRTDQFSWSEKSLAFRSSISRPKRQSHNCLRSEFTVQEHRRIELHTNEPNHWVFASKPCSSGNSLRQKEACTESSSCHSLLTMTVWLKIHRCSSESFLPNLVPTDCTTAGFWTKVLTQIQGQKLYSRMQLTRSRVELLLPKESSLR